MSDYELASLFFQVIDTAHAALANFLTVVFAVLVVTHFVAHKLDRLSAFLLLTVYSLFSIGMTNEIVSLYSDFVRLGHRMAENGATDLGWLGMTSSGQDGPVWAIPIIVGIMCVTAYLGSLVFFYRMRKRGGPNA